MVGEPEKSESLVVYDYGMGGVWAYMRARSAEERGGHESPLRALTMYRHDAPDYDSPLGAARRLTNSLRRSDRAPARPASQPD